MVQEHEKDILAAIAADLCKVRPGQEGLARPTGNRILPELFPPLFYF
jgi:hypothetical protein